MGSSILKEDAQKILIVDDTIANIQVLNEIFHSEYRIFFATSGTAGIEIAHRELPDIILLDVMMPELDGYETCSILKADPVTAGIPVIFVTAMGEEEDETRGLEVGAIDYLMKPVSPPIVKARVKNHLELKSGRDLLEKFGKELAVKNATLEKERALAHRLLGSILPEKINLPGYTTAVCYRPSNEIGGDFFDGWLDGDKAHFLIADISGHSISAALFMAVCKGLFMSIGKGKDDPGAIMAEANQTLVKMLSDSGMYLTMVYIVCDRERGLLKAASAGHNPVYLYSQAGMTGIDATGPPIGWEFEDFWDVREYRVNKGDKILLYTDGLIEVRNAEGLYCPEEIFSAVDASFTPEEILEKVLSVSESFCNGTFDDDLTLLAFSIDFDTSSGGANG
ncbi:MAG: SpoIIE family protein phosphatase [Geobacteraceae bacterium]|nr:SpoIIE family protein phosphatase [Geobacteraceae bacterium]